MDMEYSVGFDRQGKISALDVTAWMENGVAMDSGIVDFFVWKGCADQVKYSHPESYTRLPCCCYLACSSLSYSAFQAVDRGFIMPCCADMVMCVCLESQSPRLLCLVADLTHRKLVAKVQSCKLQNLLHGLRLHLMLLRVGSTVRHADHTYFADFLCACGLAMLPLSIWAFVTAGVSFPQRPFHIPHVPDEPAASPSNSWPRIVPGCFRHAAHHGSRSFGDGLRPHSGAGAQLPAAPSSRPIQRLGTSRALHR